MAWRKIERDDVKLGAIIRLESLNRDGGYCTATIIGVCEGEDITYPHVVVARPYAYASNYNTKQPLLGAEVFEISFYRLLEEDNVSVTTNRDGVAREMVR